MLPTALLFSLLSTSISHVAAAPLYPSKDKITQIFSSLASNDSQSSLAFWSHVSPTVNWTIEGTHPAAGIYTNRTVLIASFARIIATGSMESPLRLRLLNVIGGATEEWSVQELQVKGICKNGLDFDNRYAWATRWNTNSTIVEARAYLDSMMVSEALQQNELGTLFTYSDYRNTVVPFVDLPDSIAQAGSGLSRA